MLDIIINEYVKKLSTKDILIFSRYNHIDLSPAEAEYLKGIIKSNWRTILYGNPRNLFEKVRTEVGDATFERSILLFDAIQKKFKR